MKKISATTTTTATTITEKRIAAAKEAGRKALREYERRMALAAAKEMAEETKAANAALKEAFFSSALPRSARVRESGNQVIVTWFGRSVTFYKPKMAA